MRLSWFGWCSERECAQEATARVSASFGAGGEYLIAVCDEHLAKIKADLQDLAGHDLAIESPDLHPVGDYSVTRTPESAGAE